MEPFRCPTCIGLLPDAPVRRCPSCGQRLRRRRPRVLDEHTRMGTADLPVDRWMLDRVDTGHGKRRRKLPPVAWEGRFTTSRPAEPDFAPPPAPMCAVCPVDPIVIDTDDVIDTTPAMVDAGSLDMHTEAVATSAEPELPAPPAPRPQPIHQQLDPEVRALIDELYEQARAELSGDDIGFFAPVADERVDEPPVTDRSAEPPSGAPAAPNTSSDKRAGRPRSGWVAAIQTAEWQRRPRG